MLPVLLLLGACLTVAARGEEQAEKKQEPKTDEVKIDDITLIVPKTWKQGEPKNKMRKAEFLLPAVEGDKEPPELVIYYFGSFSGSIQANVNRWIGQFEPTGRKMKVTQGESPHGNYVVVDLSGTFNKPVGPPILQQSRPLPGARMLAAILTVEEKGHYYLKLTGLEKSVAASANAFRASFGGDATKEKEVEQK
jgi:gluconolactonase